MIALVARESMRGMGCVADKVRQTYALQRVASDE
jgi:hypothetical protein